MERKYNGVVTQLKMVKYGIWMVGYQKTTRVGKLPILFNNYEDYLHHSENEFVSILYLFSPHAEYVVVENTFDVQRPPPNTIVIPPNY